MSDATKGGGSGMGEQTIFVEATAKRSSQEREAFLAQACGDDPELRARVEVLLTAHDRAGGFLESPPPGVTAATGGFGEDPTGVAEHAGTIVGNYKLLEQIGEGGMGVVFTAEQLRPVRR